MGHSILCEFFSSHSRYTKFFSSMSSNAYNSAYRKLDVLRSRGSNYGSKISYSESLHDTSNSWDSKPPREHPGRDQASPVGNSWDGKWSEAYPGLDQARAAGAPLDERLYVASSAGASLERRADSRSTGLLFGRGTQDASQGSARMGASQGPMMVLSAVDPSFVGERRDVAGSSTNPFVSQGSRPGYIADPRALEFLGSTLPVTKADSIHSSRENHGKASSGKEPVAPTFTALLADEFAAVVAKIPLQGELSDEQVKSVVSPGPSVTSVSIASSQTGSSISDVSVGSDMARAHASAMSALQLEKETLNLEFEELIKKDKCHILVTDTAMIGLRGSVSTAPLDSRVYTSSEVQVLQTKLDLFEKLLDKKTADLLDLENGTRIYMIKTQREIETLKQENVSLVQDKSKLFENLLLTQDNACKIQEKLCVKLQEQNHIIQALTQCKNERCVRIKELEQSVERLVAEKRLGVSMQGEGYVCVDNPGQKMCIQAYASQDVVMAMKCLNKEILEKKLDELYSKQVIEEEIAEITEKLVQDVGMEIFMQVVQELPKIPDTKNVSEVVEEAGAGPVVQKLQAGSSSKEAKPSYKDVTEHLKKQSYSPEAFMRILEDESVVKELEKYPFFQAVFSIQALKQNLPRFCEDILHEANQLYGRKLDIGNHTLIGMLKVILLERKHFSPERLQKFRTSGEFHNSCIPTGKPTENLNAFDGTAMSYERDARNFFKYFVTVYLTWKTDASDLFAELVKQFQNDY